MHGVVQPFNLAWIKENSASPLSVADKSLQGVWMASEGVSPLEQGKYWDLWHSQKSVQ